jgi:putative oxidoreductase
MEQRVPAARLYPDSDRAQIGPRAGNTPLPDRTEGIISMNTMSSLLGRIGLSVIFIVSGFGKIAAYAGTQQYMAHAGVPGFLLPLVILLEVGGGLAILAGAFTRATAVALALFSLAAGILFHAGIADQNQFIHLLKNIAIAGGFLTLAAHGPGPISVDALRAKREVGRPLTA